MIKKHRNLHGMRSDEYVVQLAKTHFGDKPFKLDDLLELGPVGFQMSSALSRAYQEGLLEVVDGKQRNRSYRIRASIPEVTAIPLLEDKEPLSNVSELLREGLRDLLRLFRALEKEKEALIGKVQRLEGQLSQQDDMQEELHTWQKLAEEAEERATVAEKRLATVLDKLGAQETE